MSVERHDWAKLNHLQVGRYAEYLVKMECTLFGLDVYTAEVDNKGIDFVVRAGVDNFFDVQVKSVRLKPKTTPYVFMRKSGFEPRSTLLLALVTMAAGEAAKIYLIPSLAWIEDDKTIFVSRDYGEGKKSPPEWGLSLSAKANQKLDTSYRFEERVQELDGSA